MVGAGLGLPCRRDFIISFCSGVIQRATNSLVPRISRGAARTAREALSTQDTVSLDAALQDGPLHLPLARAELEALAQPLLERTLTALRKVLRDARVPHADVLGVVMVGGATRMPQIQRAVAEFFKQPPLNNLDPDKVVALGAATQANLLAGFSLTGGKILEGFFKEGFFFLNIG